ncbi:hypothetical protein ACFLQI_03335, partial [Candidatus Undinarchaeota archaeon]
DFEDRGFLDFYSGSRVYELSLKMFAAYAKDMRSKVKKMEPDEMHSIIAAIAFLSAMENRPNVYHKHGEPDSDNENKLMLPMQTSDSDAAHITWGVIFDKTVRATRISPKELIERCLEMEEFYIRYYGKIFDFGNNNTKIALDMNKFIYDEGRGLFEKKHTGKRDTCWPNSIISCPNLDAIGLLLAASAYNTNKLDPIDADEENDMRKHAKDIYNNLPEDPYVQIRTAAGESLTHAHKEEDVLLNSKNKILAFLREQNFKGGSS